MGMRRHPSSESMNGGVVSVVVVVMVVVVRTAISDWRFASLSVCSCKESERCVEANV